VHPPEDYRVLGFHAASLGERLSPLVDEPLDAREAVCSASFGIPSGVGDASSILRAWQQAFSPDDPPAFARRLEWDGLSADAVERTLALGVTSLSAEPPAWTNALPSIERHARVLADELAAGTLSSESHLLGSRLGLDWQSAIGDRRSAIGDRRDPRSPTPAPRSPIPDSSTRLIWIAIVRSVRERLEADSLPFRQLRREVRHAFERSLADDLHALGDRAAQQLFRRAATEKLLGHQSVEADTAADARRQFVLDLLGEGLWPLFAAYPVLARHLALVAERAYSAIRELVDRLERDRPCIAELFDAKGPLELVAIQPSASDSHDGRRRVALLEFDGGLKLVYKPRDVALERAWNGWLEWAAAEGLEPAPPSLRVLDRGGYGWVEFVRHEPLATPDDVRVYFRRAGSLLCLSWVMGGRDLHVENIIATRRGPVLIDTEMLLQPAGSGLLDATPSASPHHVMGSPARTSCLETGMLTLLVKRADGSIADVGGLRGESTASTPHGGSSPHHAVLNGAVQRPEAYSREIVDGFERAFRFLSARRDALLNPKGPLREFAGSRSRLVFRPSEHYGSVFEVMSTPRFQRSGAIRSCALESLNRVFNTDVQRPRLWPLTARERAAIELLDVPRFTIQVRELCVDEARDAGPLFAMSGLDATRKRLATLSEYELQRQLHLLSTALTESPRSRFSRLPPPDRAERAPGADSRHPASLPRAGQRLELDRARYVDHAVWIAEELVVRAERHGRALIWPRANDRIGSRSASAHDLYDGALGPALFFAAMAAVTRRPDWAEAARAATWSTGSWLLTVRPTSDDGFVGVGHGVGSLIYGLVWIGRLLGDDSYLGLARRAANLIAADRIEQDRALDVTCGVAGTLLALHALRDEADDPVLVRLTDACVARLLTTQVRRGTGAAWRVLDGAFHTGFAHGASGIGHALVRHFVRTGREDCRDAALRAFEFERALHSSSAGEWAGVDASDSPRAGVATFMTAWCHGAPGIALARGSVRGLTESSGVASDWNAAIAATLRKRPASFESVCCGNLGRADILLTLGHATGDPALLAAAHGLGQAAIARARARGHFTLNASGYMYRAFDAGFFQGLSGVGYVLLRLAAPDALPSVLSFESPHDRRRASHQEVMHGRA
jgi:lantibiotic modifying enzyme